MLVSRLQQTQLYDLLDSVPDKVLICSKKGDERTPDNLYSNREMNRFFGTDIVLNDHRSGRIEGVSRSKTRVRRSCLTQRVFHEL